MFALRFRIARELRRWIRARLRTPEPPPTDSVTALVEQAKLALRIAQSTDADCSFTGAASIGYGTPVFVFKVDGQEFGRATAQPLSRQPKPVPRRSLWQRMTRWLRHH